MIIFGTFVLIYKILIVAELYNVEMSGYST